MRCALRPGLALYIMIGGVGWAQNRPSKKTSGITAEARPGSTIRHGQRQWKLIRQIKATFNPLPSPCQILLLESSESTDTGGAGQPLNDAELLIQYGNSILYDYAKEGTKQAVGRDAHFYIDDYLELKDFGQVGVPEILFHSGSIGASDWTTLEHVLYYDKLGSSFVDLAPAFFYHSGRHGLKWLSSGSRTFAVVADENWRSTIPVEARCHYCPSPFQYSVYEWNRKRAMFGLSLHLDGQKSYSEAQEALDGDWALIQARIEH